YPMSTALGMVSLYFLHLGFKSASSFYLSLGGITAGLCLAAAIPGKQYVLVLVLFALLYTGLHLKTLNRSVKWSSVSLILYLVLAVVKRRYEIAMLATIPVVGGFVAGAEERRVGLLPMPFWIILMGFAFAGLLRLRLPPGFKIIILGVAGSALACGFVPSIQYIYGKTKSPFSVYHFAQAEVAASRFLKNIVAGRQPTNPHLERDELKRHEGPDAPYNTLICPNMAYSILHLFLHDYGDQEILS